MEVNFKAAQETLASGAGQLRCCVPYISPQRNVIDDAGAQKSVQDFPIIRHAFRAQPYRNFFKEVILIWVMNGRSLVYTLISASLG